MTEAAVTRTTLKAPVKGLDEIKKAAAPVVKPAAAVTALEGELAEVKRVYEAKRAALRQMSAALLSEYTASVSQLKAKVALAKAQKELASIK